MYFEKENGFHKKQHYGIYRHVPKEHVDTGIPCDGSCILGTHIVETEKQVCIGCKVANKTNRHTQRLSKNYNQEFYKIIVQKGICVG